MSRTLQKLLTIEQRDAQKFCRGHQNLQILLLVRVQINHLVLDYISTYKLFFKLFESNQTYHSKDIMIAIISISLHRPPGPGLFKREDNNSFPQLLGIA